MAQQANVLDMDKHMMNRFQGNLHLRNCYSSTKDDEKKEEPSRWSNSPRVGSIFDPPRMPKPVQANRPLCLRVQEERQQ